MSLGGRKRGWVGGEALQYNEHTIIWGIRDSKWQDKSNQNAETIECKKEMATATKMQRWVSKSYQCSSSSLWSHLTSQAATSPSYESSEWAKATAYWEKTTAHSQELSSSLLKLTHKLQVHTRNLKITLLLEFKGSN